MTVERTEFALKTVLDNVASLMLEKRQAKGLELVLDVDPAVPDHLVGDPLRLGQILINYTNNAVKFTERGEISLRIRVSEENDQTVLLHFAVRDTGIGLTEAQKNLLFQSFSQVDRSATRRFGGTGLGLAISKRLAELMGGSVGVDSIHGQGSTFWFTARLGRTTADPLARLSASHLRGRRVLVVDDNENARMILAEMLTNMTLAVDTVASGQAAVDAVRRSARHRPYALVILDWWMPDMDGIETAWRIHALGLAETPHFIMVTAYGYEEVFKQAGEMFKQTQGRRIEEVLIKPISPSTLLETVTRVLGASPPYPGPSPEVVEDLTICQGGRILLVEDNELNQEVAMALLVGAGCVVDTVANGEQAVGQVQQAGYDLVLMDMQMPVMDGVTATRAIRQLSSLPDLPIVAMTANAMREDREQCLAAGMNDYLAKPIEPDDLWRILRKWIKPRLSSQGTRGEARTTVTAQLPPIHGLDIKAGLRRVLGDQTRYLSLLRKFLASEKTFPATLAVALDLGDWDAAEHLVHTFKGVAGSISALELHGGAILLEEAIREKRPRQILDERLAAVAACLAPLMVELETKLPPIPSPRSIADVDRAREICASLASRLAVNDFVAHAILEANANLLQDALGDDGYRDITEGVRQFDFERALQTLTRVAETANIFKQRKSLN
ncbi:two-component system, sensor histidine kinase and response regulator [Gammaproteobacteria bacterium]